MSEEPKDIVSGGYTWLEIDRPEDYDRLSRILDVEFEPDTIARQLKNSISDLVSGVLIEHDYIDKDYRNTFCNFHAKMGRPYQRA